MLQLVLRVCCKSTEAKKKRKKTLATWSLNATETDIQALWRKVCCKVSCNPASQQAPDASIYPQASLSAQTFPWLGRHLGMGCTHNAKKTGVLCQLSLQTFFLLPPCVKSQSCIYSIVCHQWHNKDILIIRLTHSETTLFNN